MKPRDYILEQIHHRQTSPIPFTLPFEEGVDKRLDSYYGSDNWRKKIPPYMASHFILDPIKEEPIDSNRIKDAFGSIWRRESDASRFAPHLEQPALREPSFDNFEFPSVTTFLDNELEKSARKHFFQERPDSFKTIWIPYGLFEESWRIRGFENTLMDMVSEPDFTEELLDNLTELYLAFVERCIDWDVDAIWFGDDWGDQRSVIMGPELWRKYLKPRWAKIYEATHAQGKIAMSHSCGNVTDIMPDIVEIGLDVLESVQSEAMNPYELKKKWGDKITFWGGLGTQNLIPFGTPKQLTDEISRLCREMGRNGGYFLAPSKPLRPETPTENLVAIFEAFTNQSQFG